MSKYQKKPVVIEAYLLLPNDGILRDPPPPTWFVAAVFNGIVHMLDFGGADIETLEGRMRASVGDWIIKGVKDEIYSCKPDIFEATYEKVEVNDDSA